MAITGQATTHGGSVSTGGAAGGNLGPVLLEEFGDEVTSQFNNEAHLMLLLDEGAEDELWQGEYYVEPLHTGRSRAGGAGRETDDYPDPGIQGYNQLQIGTAFYRTAGQITSKAFNIAERGDATSVRALESDIRGGLRDLIQEINVDMYGSVYGPLGVMSAAAAGAVCTLTNTYGAAGAFPVVAANGTRFLSGGRNQVVYILGFNPADGTTTNFVRSTVSTVDTRTQFTATAVVAAGTGAGNIVVQAPSSAAGDNLGVTDVPDWHCVGLDQIIDDGTTMPAVADANYFGVNRTAGNVPILQSFVRNMAGAVTTEAVLQDFLDAIGETSGETPGGLLMHRSVRTQFMQDLSPDRRFRAQEFKGGFQGRYLVYNPGDGDVGIYVDRHAPYRTIYAINMNHMKRYTAAPAHLVEHDGSALRRVNRAPAWEWNIEAYFNLACTKPNTCGKLVDCAGDATFGSAGFLPEF
jgi:hypothetical protein